MKYVPPRGGDIDDSYIDGNPSGGIEGSAVPAAAVEHPQREIVAAIIASGQTPDDEDMEQLAKAISRGKLLNVQVFATAGTFAYTPTLGAKSVVVEGVGAGGGSGGVAATGAGQSAVSGGGGGGGYFKTRLTSGFSGITVTVGAGGLGGAAGPNQGQVGGTTSFGGLCSATGGIGGTGGIASSGTAYVRAGGAGGVGVGGNLINSVGSKGQAGLQLSGELYAGGGGTTGLGLKSGGDGIQIGVSTAATPGITGAPGCVVVWEYA